MAIDSTGFGKEPTYTNGVNGHAHSSEQPNHSNSNGNASPPSPIAVVGMACRFAGDATSPEKLWELCSSGRDAWSRIPESRFDVNSLYDANSEKPGRNHSTGGYFLQQDVAAFDATFFNFTSEVASAMDPQLRMLLEVVFEATEDAGIPIEKAAGPDPNTSVFVGCYTKDYHDLQARDPETMPASTLTGNYTAMFSNRVSHFYDFQGASMSIDTGCSAALAALHQGCQTIRTGESSISIIGASNAILNPDIYIAMSSLGMVGADGRCYAWDSRAQGYGRGEGVAVIVLKSLDAALRDGDRVHAVIRNSGLNQDGKTATITSPSLEAQMRLIRDCYRGAGLSLSETGYVEAHMTGTQAGDAAEAESLARTFGASRHAEDPVWVGSVKTNVGHTEGVSGLAGIIKAAMAMKHKAIPPNLNYLVGSAKIPLGSWHLRVPTSVVPWPSDKPLRASINNFGYGGTNAHVILEAPPETAIGNGGIPERDDGVSRLYVLSAQDPTTLKSMASNLASYLRHGFETDTPPAPAALAHTLSARRSRLSNLTAIRAPSLASLEQALSLSATLKISHCPPARTTPRLGFVFNGQGAQWHAMGRELLAAYPVFSAAVDDADAALRGYGADWSLREELLRDAKTTRVSEIHLGQPVTVALQICLVILLRAWGIRPAAVTSHSSGEIAAAYAAGALSFEQALGVTYWRGELARGLFDNSGGSKPVGGMAAGGVGAEEAAGYISGTKSGGKVVVACVNSPNSVTFSGDVEDLKEVVARLEADGKFARKLNVPLAYHSHHMLRMAGAYAEKLRQIVPSTPTWSAEVIYTSPVTGGIIASPDKLVAEHYVDNLTRPVLFAQAFEAMCFGPDGKGPAQVDAIVEIGPHSTLSGPIRQILLGRKMAYTSCLKRPVDAVNTMQDLASDLLRLGYPVALEAVNSSDRASFVHDLPAYPWNHANRYWVESRINHDVRFKKFPPHELLGIPVSGATTPTWRNFLRLIDLPWVGDHRVDGDAVLPGAAYISMAIEATRMMSSSDSSSGVIQGYQVRDVEILSALAVPETGSSSGDRVETHLTLRPLRDETGWYAFEVQSLGSNGVWVTNCRGEVSATVDMDSDDVVHDPDSFLGARIRQITGTALRAHVAEMGIEYGPAFQGVVDGKASTTTQRAATTVRIQGTEESAASSYVIHPQTLDCIIQATYTNLPPGTGKTSVVLPRSLQAMTVQQSLHSQPDRELVVFSELSKAQRKGFTSRVSVVNSPSDRDGQARLTLQGLFCQAIPRPRDTSSEGPSVPLAKTRWEPDVLYNIPPTFKDEMRIILRDGELDMEKKLARASYHLIADAVTAIEARKPDFDNWTHGQRLLFDWMKTVVTKAQSGQLAAGSKMWARASKGVKQMLFDELKTSGPYGDLLIKIGSALAGIASGDTTVGDLAQQYGDNVETILANPPRVRNRSHKHLAKLVQLFAVTNPGAKVLEIAAGTGETTQAVLEAFTPHGEAGSLVGAYTVTSPTAAPLEATKAKTTAWADLLEFRELDIGQDPVSVAGLIAHSMDLIVINGAKYVTKDPEQALKNVRKLLRTGGKLILVEPTQDRLDAQLIWGALSGSETTEDGPAPAHKVEAWNGLLRAGGFTGVDFDIADCEQAQYQGSSVIMATATSADPEEVSSLTDQSIAIVALSQSTQNIASLVQEVTARTGVSASGETLDSVDPIDKTCIMVDLANGKTLLDSLDEAAFDRLRHVLTTSPTVLWLTTGGGAVDTPTPASAQVQGLLRTLRHEDTTRTYTMLDLPRNWIDNTESVVGHILDALKRARGARDGDLASADWEYAVADSILHVPRVYPARNDSRSDTEVESLQPFYQPGRALVWDERAALGKPGYVQDDSAKTIADNMIEIETRAFSVDGLGYRDEEVRAYEVSGVVTRLGQDALASGLQVGDAVCGLGRGPYSSTPVVPWTSFAKLPDGVPLIDAASVPLAYSAAYHALVHVAKLQKGETALILHPVDSRDMQATLAVARHIGADVTFAAATKAEAQILIDRYDAPAHRIISRRGTSDVAAAILEKTNSKGVNVIITGPPVSSSSTSLLRSACDSIARFGRLVEVGGGLGKGIDVAALAARCATYGCVDVLQLAEHSPKAMKEALEASFQILRDIKQPPLNVMRFSASQLSKALQHVRQQQRQGSHAGKVVVIPQDGELVQVLPRAQQPPLEDKNATFLVVGGVGGIGGAIALWMASKGAKNVVVVSRNAERHEERGKMAQEAESKGCRLQFLDGDVSSEESLAAVLARIATSLPPIRGVVHAASVLDDTIFERMTFSQWQRATKPKIAGASNLHKYLPKDLSFFVLLSSITGIVGHASQANYAAANTFEDALARYRVALGLTATSLALPAITGAGMVANDSGAHQRIEALGTESISVETVLELIGMAIEKRTPASGEVIVGLLPWDRLPTDAAVRRDNRFGTLRLAVSSSSSSASASGQATTLDPTAFLVQTLRDGDKGKEGMEKVAGALGARLAAIFNVPVESVDLGIAVAAHGVDSLVAIELRNWLASAAKAKLSIFDILQSASLRELAELVVGRSTLG
ncbi:hypothetical protein OQA88_666 [Cercophora sp. LCS_1]